MAKIQETTEAEEILDQIENQERLLVKLVADVQEKKDALKDAKEAYDAGLFELRRLAQTRIADEFPLFDADEGGDE